MIAQLPQDQLRIKCAPRSAQLVGCAYRKIQLRNCAKLEFLPARKLRTNCANPCSQFASMQGNP
jgi:hypothetical protein